LGRTDRYKERDIRQNGHIQGEIWSRMGRHRDSDMEQKEQTETEKVVD